MAEVSDARDDVARAADAVQRAATVGIVVFTIVGVVAAVALLVAVSGAGDTA
jgi:cobalamin biosynthesis Mg chelatase CobN